MLGLYPIDIPEVSCGRVACAGWFDLPNNLCCSAGVITFDKFTTGPVGLVVILTGTWYVGAFVWLAAVVLGTCVAGLALVLLLATLFGLSKGSLESISCVSFWSSIKANSPVCRYLCEYGS